MFPTFFMLVEDVELDVVRYLSLVLSLSLLNFKPQSIYHVSLLTYRPLQPRLIRCAKHNRKCVRIITFTLK